MLTLFQSLNKQTNKKKINRHGDEGTQSSKMLTGFYSRDSWFSINNSSTFTVCFVMVQQSLRTSEPRNLNFGFLSTISNKDTKLIKDVGKFAESTGG